MLAAPDRSASGRATLAEGTPGTPARFAAAAFLGVLALGFAAIGWSMLVLPSLRTLAPAELPSAVRLSGMGPILLGVGGLHALAAVLVLNRFARNRLAGGALAGIGAGVGIILLAASIGGRDALAGFRPADPASPAVTVALAGLVVAYSTIAFLVSRRDPS